MWFARCSVYAIRVICSCSRRVSAILCKRLFGKQCTAVLGLYCHIRITPQPLRPVVWAQSFLQDGRVTTGVEGTGDGRHYCLWCRYYHPSQRLYTFITSMHLILSFKHNAMDARGKSAWCQSYVRCRSTWWLIGIAVLAGPPHWPEGYSDEQDALTHIRQWSSRSCSCRVTAILWTLLTNYGSCNHRLIR